MQREQQYLAISRMETLITLLLQATSAPYELGARVYGAGIALIKDEIISPACKAVLARFHPAPNVLKNAFTSALACEVRDDVSRAVEAFWDGARRCQWESIVGHDVAIGWPGPVTGDMGEPVEDPTLRDVLDYLRTPEALEKPSWGELVRLGELLQNSIAPALKRWKDGRALQAAERARDRLNAELTWFEYIHGVTLQYDLSATLEYLRRFCSDVEDAASGRMLDEISSKEFLWRATSTPRHGDDATGFIEPLIRLLSLTRDELAKGPVQEHVVARLVAFFENDRFGKGPLVERIRDEGVGRIETVIQREVDRFLYEQGVFPITHCEATNGRLDTFVDAEALPAVSDASRAASPPLLLELKQCYRLESPPSNAELVRVAETAKVQAGIYAQTMQARNRHMMVRVFPLVFHNVARWVLPEELQHDVRLVYLGPVSPSKI